MGTRSCTNVITFCAWDQVMFFYVVLVQKFNTVTFVLTLLTAEGSVLPGLFNSISL